MDELNHIIGYYIAFLRSIALTHKNSHWVVSGSNFYGQHLLFDRMYDTAAKNSDLAAEKMIGNFGVEIFNPKIQASMIGHILSDYANGTPLENSTKIEEKFLELSKKLYDALKEEDKLSLGLDDFILATADDSENSLYLLKQAGNSKEASNRINARKKLLNKLTKF